MKLKDYDKWHKVTGGVSLVFGGEVIFEGFVSQLLVSPVYHLYKDSKIISCDTLTGGSLKIELEWCKDV